MGLAREPRPALLVIAALHTGQDVCSQARALLERQLGPVRQVGPELAFGWTDYYESEMGPGLSRCFLAAERLVPPGSLADLKRLTDRIEGALSRPDGNRRINLDPGLLNLHNFVLASTKCQPQRIYLRDGIYAEVTLHYSGGRFEPLTRTYPEYRSEGTLDLLTGLRQEYKGFLRAGSACLDPAALVDTRMEA